MLIDTHAHLCYPDFANDLPQIVERARAVGVERIVSIATDLDSAKCTLDVAQRFDGVYVAVGLHPNDVQHSTLCDMKQLRRLATEAKIVAIGETGLDYHRLVARASPPVNSSTPAGDPAAVASATSAEEETPAILKQQQKDLFWAQLELAKELRLPVVIHNRAAESDVLEILRAHVESLPKDFRPWGVMHCFGGDERFAFDCIEIGLLISYTGILTFKNAAPLREVAKKVSLDFVMLETDAPYLAPQPHRGKRNEPSYVPLIAETLAQVKGVSVEEVARATTENAQRVFRFAGSR
ncbi:MAG: TatD family hydrolase [Verrucomicrobiia bacterium]